MKPVIAISCPIDTFSGYGARARDVVKALINSEKYEVKILSQRWGSTPFGFLNPLIPDHKKIIDCIQPSNNKLENAPDIWIQITVPNEFQKVGKYNIGITAGIETDLCATTWIEGCNRMDLVLTSCNHSKNVFLNSKYEQRKKDNPEEVVGIIETTVPVEVLFEGVDTQIYKKTNQIDEFGSHTRGIETYEEVSKAAREWVLSDESMMSAKNMCKNVIDGIDETFNKWEPRYAFELIKVESLEQPKHFVKQVIAQ